MFFKIRTLVLMFFTIIGLLSCSQSLPKGEPNLELNIDTPQLNTTLKVTAPKSVNSYKLGTPLELEIINLSDQVLDFNTDEIQIFCVKNDLWEKVTYKEIIIVDDLIMEPNELNSVSSLTLAPNGVFPGFKRVFPVFPDLNSDKSVFLRIFVFAHAKEPENMSQNIVGAFVDVTLIP